MDHDTASIVNPICLQPAAIIEQVAKGVKHFVGKDSGTDTPFNDWQMSNIDGATDRNSNTGGRPELQLAGVILGMMAANVKHLKFNNRGKPI